MSREQDMAAIARKVSVARRDELRPSVYTPPSWSECEPTQFAAQMARHSGPAIFGPYTRPSRIALALKRARYHFDNQRERFYNLEPVYRLRGAWFVLRHGGF